jgi:carbon monoxide dehydrogenase subunit G
LEALVKPMVSRTFITRASPEAVFDYFADFRNAEQFDPGTRSCVRVSGDGGVGTVYHNVSSFLGRQVKVTYTTAELERPTRVHLTSHNDWFDGHDLLDIRASGSGSEVTYTAEFAFSGGARFTAPLVTAGLPFLSRKVVGKLHTCLDRLP